MTRLLYLAVGAGLGIVAVRRANALVRSFTAEGVADRAGATGERIAQWWAIVQEGAALREAELREALGLEAGGEEAA